MKNTNSNTNQAPLFKIDHQHFTDLKQANIAIKSLKKEFANGLAGAAFQLVMFFDPRDDILYPTIEFRKSLGATEALFHFYATCAYPFLRKAALAGDPFAINAMQQYIALGYPPIGNLANQKMFDFWVRQESNSC